MKKCTILLGLSLMMAANCYSMIESEPSSIETNSGEVSLWDIAKAKHESMYWDEDTKTLEWNLSSLCLTDVSDLTLFLKIKCQKIGLSVSDASFNINLSNNKLKDFDLSDDLPGLVKLDLSNNLLKKLPLNFVRLLSLKELNLSNNQFTRIPEHIVALEYVENLDLSYNPFTAEGLEMFIHLIELFPHIQKINLNHIIGLTDDDISTIIKSSKKGIVLTDRVIEIRVKKANHFSHISQKVLNERFSTEAFVDDTDGIRQCGFLDLSNLGLTDISYIDQMKVYNGSALVSLSEIEELTIDLSKNNLTAVPDEIGNMTNISMLDLSDNALGNLPESFSKLKACYIDLRSNQFTTFPLPLLSLDSQRGFSDNNFKLDLSNNSMSELPENINYLGSKFADLNLSHNKLKRLPDSFGQLRCFMIDLSHNELEVLPMEMGNMLTHESEANLDLSHNKLKTLPQSFSLLESQNVLLSHNLFEVFPSHILSMPNVARIKISHNQISVFPEITAQRVVSSLDLSYNNFSTFPKEICDLYIEHLDLSNNSLESIPQEIANLPDLTQLSLANNKLSSLPDSMSALTNLIKLEISGNKLNVFPVQALVNLPSLEHLNLSNNGLESLPDEIANVSNLTQLILKNNKLTSLPEMSALTNLKILDISSNKFKVFPTQALVRLPHLEDIDLSNNSLESLPQEIANVSHVRKFCLENNKLSSLPDSMSALTNLTTLNISGNKFNVFPEALASLFNLEYLDLSNNLFVALPESMGALRALKWLDLHHNAITQLPNAIGKLERLITLDVSFNALTSVSESIGALQKLQWLGLQYNQLEVLPATLQNLKALKWLGLSNNHLDQSKYIFTDLPLVYDPFAQNSLQNLPAKKLVLPYDVLDLSNQDLTDITGISQLLIYNDFGFEGWKMIAQIEELGLNLACNRLSIVPEDIANLVYLKSLNLRNNKLTRVPGIIGSLSELESLDVSNNDLQSLPQSLHHLSRLEYLGLSGNPLCLITKFESNGESHQEQVRIYYANNPSINVPPLNVGQKGRLGELLTKLARENKLHYFDLFQETLRLAIPQNLKNQSTNAKNEKNAITIPLEISKLINDYIRNA